MNRNIAKPFTATLSLLDVASDKTHKYKCFHGEDVQLTVKVVGEGQRPIDLSNTSVKIYFTLDKNVNEPVYRQDTGIVVDNLGIITVMLEKSYIRIGNNVLKIALYDEDQTVFLQPLIISCIDPLIGAVADLEIPDDINVRDELSDIRRIIGDLQDFDEDLGREIIEARNEHGTVGERLDNFDSQLGQIATKFEKPKRSKIGVSALWSAQQWDTPLGDMKRQVDLWVENEVEEISYIVNVQYINNDFTIFGNQDNALQALQYAEGKGIKVVCIKVHGAEADDIAIYGLDRFKTKWKDILNSIHLKFQMLPNIKYFVVLNEREFMLDDATNYETFIIECLNQMKAYGYKVGISTTNTYYSCIKFSDNVRAVIDCFFINQYPSLSFSGIDTTMEQCESVWNSLFLIGALENLSQYKKPIIMSESGVRDYYEYLANPSNYTWDDLGVTPSINGEVGILYLGSLLKSDFIKYITSTWLWFNETFMKEDVKKYIDLYKGGVING